MSRTLKDLLHILGSGGRRRMAILVLAMVAVAAAEAASVAVVLPFIQLALNPSAAETELSLRLVERLPWGGDAAPVIVIGWLALGLFVASSCMSALAGWVTFRIAAAENRRLSVRLLAGYMAQRYPFFLERNTSDLAKNVLHEIDKLTNDVYVPLTNVIGRGMMVLCIVGLLVYASPLMAAVVIGAVGLLYGGMYALMRGPVARLGVRRVDSNTDRFRAAQEALGGIKEIKVLGREDFFVQAFARSAAEYTQVIASGQIVGSVPRYFLEAVGIGGVLVLLLFSLQRGQAGAAVVPVLALYAAAAYRIMPALQQIYSGVMNVRFNTELIRVIRRELDLHRLPSKQREAASGPAAPAMRFERAITLEGVSHRYAGTDVAVLDGLSVEISKHSSVGIAGETGSGKSTLVDVILGLLMPDSGRITIDGVPLTSENIRSWQSLVGYVPQTIYLADASIRNNIALGVDAGQIDDEAVVRAATLAGVHRFIGEETARGYDTVVGERGVRLSGGQRQRIGIARALYRDPEVLILDEATSSLDNVTEQAVMASVRLLSRQKTIIVVAHRLTTIRDCDSILVIRKGRISEAGTFDELVERDGELASLARGQSST